MRHRNGLGTVARDVADSQLIGKNQNGIRNRGVGAQSDGYKVFPILIDTEVGVTARNPVSTSNRDRQEPAPDQPPGLWPGMPSRFVMLAPLLPECSRRPGPIGTCHDHRRTCSNHLA